MTKTGSTLNEAMASMTDAQKQQAIDFFIKLGYEVRLDANCNILYLSYWAPEIIVSHIALDQDTNQHKEG